MEAVEKKETSISVEWFSDDIIPYTRCEFCQGKADLSIKSFPRNKLYIVILYVCSSCIEEIIKKYVSLPERK